MVYSYVKRALLRNYTDYDYRGTRVVFRANNFRANKLYIYKYTRTL